MSELLCIGGSYNGVMIKYLGSRPMLNRQQYIHNKVIYFDGTWSEYYVLQGMALCIPRGCPTTVNCIEVMG